MKNIKWIKLDGFTFIELLVVVLIITILVVMALPQYQKAVAKSRATQLQVLLDSAIKAMGTYYLENGKYATYFTDLNLDTQLPIENGNDKQTCLKSSWVGRSVIKGDGFELALFNYGVHKSYRIAAYFTTGKYKCNGFAYFFNDSILSLNHKFFCFEGYYTRYCGTNCKIGIFCDQLMNKKRVTYRYTSYLYK